ncbi:MAG: hypothetical protein ACI4EF_00490 [Coprococcus sp.]
MKKIRRIGIISILSVLLLLTSCKGDDENTTETGYGAGLIEKYNESSETVNDYNDTKQKQYEGIDDIED